MAGLLKHGRGLLVVVAVLAIALAACGSSGGKSAAPGGTGGGGGQPTATSGGGGGPTPTSGGGGGGGGLSGGLSANLDKLDSYQFSYRIMAGEASASAEGITISGIAINKPTKSLLIRTETMGIQYLVIGDQGWMSMDGGQSWIASPDTTYDSLADQLPASGYADNFDDLVTDMKVVGEEQKNGVQCTHYKGDESALNAVYGVSSQAQADLWVAKDGNYPISGFFAIQASAGGQSGYFGYAFDVTHLNDTAANTLPTP